MASIVLKDVSFHYITAKKKVISNFSYSFEAGKLYAVVGPNASGKTTLCNILRGFVPHFYEGKFSGEVLLNGADIKHMDLGELGKNIGFVFQNPFTQITGIRDTVYDEVAYSLENLGVESEEIRQRVENVIERLGLEELRERKPYELSGGQRQRVAVASIMVMDPKIFILDEPTSQLDPYSSELIFSIIKQLKEEGITIILVEHKIDLIAEFADEVLALSGGKLLASGRPEDVFASELCDLHRISRPAVTDFALAVGGNSSRGPLPIKIQEAYEYIDREGLKCK